MVYRAVAAEKLPPQLTQALREHARRRAALLAPQRRRRLLALAERRALSSAVLDLAHYCLSDEVAAPLREAGASRLFRSRRGPTEAALLALIAGVKLPDPARRSMPVPCVGRGRRRRAMADEAATRRPAGQAPAAARTIDLKATEIAPEPAQPSEPVDPPRKRRAAEAAAEPAPRSAAAPPPPARSARPGMARAASILSGLNAADRRARRHRR